MLRSAFIRLIYMAVMFLAGLILSNLAMPEQFGTISLILLNASLLSIVTGLGSESMIFHKVANNKWNSIKALQFSWCTIIIQIALFFVLEAGSLFIWGKTLLSNEKPGYLPVDALYFIGLLLGEKYLALLYSFHKSFITNLVLTIIGSVYLIILFLIYYFIRIDFARIIYLFAFQSFFQGCSLALLFHLINKSPGKERLGFNEFLNALKMSSVVVVTNVVQLMAYRVDFWLLKYMYSNYEVGLYAQANKFANLVWLIPNILAQLLIPKITTVPKKELGQFFCVAFYLNLVSIIATILCANVFYFFYLKIQYQAGLSALYWMLPGYFFWAMVIYFGAYFSWAGKFTYNLIGSSGCFILILLADLFLIPRYGLAGAALANTIVYTIIFIFYVIVLTRKFLFKWSDFILIQKVDFLSISKFFTK